MPMHPSPLRSAETRERHRTRMTCCLPRAALLRTAVLRGNHIRCSRWRQCSALTTRSPFHGVWRARFDLLLNDGNVVDEALFATMPNRSSLKRQIRILVPLFGFRRSMLAPFVLCWPDSCGHLIDARTSRWRCRIPLASCNVSPTRRAINGHWRE